MEIEGKVWKDGKLWLIEIPSLDAMTQGRTKKGVLEMAEDLVFEMVKSYFKEEAVKDFKVFATSPFGKEVVAITTNDTKLFMALSLRRQREKSGSTLQEAAERLGSRSPNAYAHYEKGGTGITIEKFEHLLVAANPREQRKLRLV